LLHTEKRVILILILIKFKFNSDFIFLSWWRSSVHSHLTTTEKENTTTENEQTLNDQQQQNIHFRRPSEPTISNEQQNIQRNSQLNNYSDLTPNYLISPPKKKIGPKKTKSTFAILFPNNVFCINLIFILKNFSFTPTFQ